MDIQSANDKSYVLQDYKCSFTFNSSESEFIFHFLYKRNIKLKKSELMGNEKHRNQQKTKEWTYALAT